MDRVVHPHTVIGTIGARQEAHTTPRSATRTAYTLAVAVTIWLTSGHGRHPGVEIVSDDPTERTSVSALAAFLRTRPAWNGPGRLSLHIRHPRAVADIFVPATTIVSVERLESEAAMTWEPYGERGASVALIEWYRDVRRALSDELRELARQPPELPFPPA